MFQKIKKLFKRTNELQQDKHCVVEILILNDHIQILINQNSICLIPNKQTYSPTIEFDKNEINIGKENGINIFTTEKQQIEYQQKQYILQSYELISLYFIQFKRLIDNQWIPYEWKITNNNQSIDKNILIKGLFLSDCSSIEINGEKQENMKLNDELFEQIDEIFYKQDDYLLFKKKIERMKSIISKERMKSLYHFLQLQPNDDYSSTKLNEIQSQLTCLQRSKLRLYQLDDNYCLYLSSMFFRTIDDFINLELSMKRMQGNLSKFFHNPIGITPQTRQFFPNLRTLYIYHHNDERFLSDPLIQKRIEWKVSELNLFIDQVTQIESLTKMNCQKLLFDSDKDNWELGSKQLMEQVNNKVNVVLLIETEDNESFGYCKFGKVGDINDKNKRSFQFSIDSNNRFPCPMKFELMNEQYDSTFVRNDGIMIHFGNIVIYHKDMKHCSYWNQCDDEFYYPDKKTILYHNHYFNPKSFKFIQLI